MTKKPSQTATTSAAHAWRERLLTTGAGKKTDHTKNAAAADRKHQIKSTSSSTTNRKGRKGQRPG